VTTEAGQDHASDDELELGGLLGGQSQLRRRPRRGTKFSTFAYRPVSSPRVNWIRKRKGGTVWRFSDGRVQRSQGSSASTTRITVDWSKLSPRGMAIRRQIEQRALCGYSTSEIATQLGTSSSWVLSRRRELRQELERRTLSPLATPVQPAHTSRRGVARGSAVKRESRLPC
jgi:hypothetical protein